MFNRFSKQIAKYTAVIGLSVSILFLAFGPSAGPTQSVTQPKKAHAQSVSSAIGEGLGKGLTQCLGNVLTQFAIPQAIGKVAGLLFVNPPTGIPGYDAATQIAQGQEAFTKFLNESCLNPIAFFAAKSTLNQLADDTVAWVNSGFQKFGRPGNKGYVGNLDGFLSGVKDAGFNRFLQELQVAGPGNPLSGVCESFQPQVVRSVADRYFARNQTPSGVQPKQLTASTTVAASTCENLSQALSTTSIRSFVSGDFEKGGWAAFQQTLENPGANPVSAFLAQNQRIQTKLKQATDRKEGEIERQKGFLGVKTCSAGKLSTSTNTCVKKKEVKVETDDPSTPIHDPKYEKREVTVSEPKTKTPGSVVENQLNKVVGSGQRQLELADEINEIVAGLTDQLIGKITGTGADRGPGGVFSQAAQEASVSGSPGGSESEDRGFEAGFAADYASSTLAEQIQKEQRLASLVNSLPSTNDLARTKAKAKQGIKEGAFVDSPGKVQEVERLVATIDNLESEVFPPAEGTRDTRNKEEILRQAQEANNQNDTPEENTSSDQLTKIDWVGNKTELEYGKAKRLDKCNSFAHAYDLSFVPKRSSGRWEVFICAPSDSTAFNETRSRFNGKFIKLPDYLLEKFSPNTDENEEVDLSLYRTDSRSGKVKIDWTGAEFDWKHYYPLIKFAEWPKEDVVKLDDDETTHINKTFLRTEHVDTPGKDLGETEAEKLSEVSARREEKNRYGTQVCDRRTLGDLSYIVKPHDNVWTIQQCVVNSHNIQEEDNSILGGIIGTIATGGVGGFIAGEEAFSDSGNKDVNHFRFADLQKIKNPDVGDSPGKVVEEYLNGNKPKAFRKIRKQPDSFSSYLTEINNLIGDDNPGETPDNQFSAPAGQPDNLRELLYDFNNIDQNSGAQIADRKQLLDERFGRLEERFHTDGDIAAAEVAQEELTISAADNSTSTLERLKAINRNKNLELPEGWEPPVSGADDDTEEGDNGDGDETGAAVINNFTAQRSGSRELIQIRWNTNASQCTAENNRGHPNWSGQLDNPGSGVTSLRSQQSVRFVLECSTEDGRSVREVRNVNRSDFDARNFGGN